MGQILSLAPSPGAIDAAWDEYASKMQQLERDPKLLTNRQFNEETARLHERWRRLFLRTDARDSGPEAV